MPRLTVLGSADAFGAGGRLYGSYLVETSRATFLLECGPSVLQGLKRAGCSPERLDFALISHFHGDHFGGLPFLFMEYRYQTARTRPFTLYAPPGGRERVDNLFSALYRTIASTDSPFDVRFEDVRPDVPVEIDGIRVEPFAVPHVPELMCLGYRITADGRTLCFSGDSAWGPHLARAAAGTDLFLCECSTYDTQLGIHVSYPEVAAHAAALGCKRLVLTHLGDEVLARAAGLELELAADGQTIDF